MGSRSKKRVSQQTRDRALKLRKQTTEPEKLLWSILRARQLAGLKFRRQHPIEPYIVDFYCAPCQLVIELDGESHEGRQQYDAEREKYLHNLGLTVFRVTNDDVMNNLEGVAEAIYRATLNERPLP